MAQLLLFVAAPVAVAAGLAWLLTYWWARRRLDAAGEFSDAARGDAEELAWRLRDLQESLAAGLPVDADEFYPPRMPRMEGLLIDAAEQDLRRSFRIRRLTRRAERAASQT